jgi:hypothetical protein
MLDMTLDTLNLFFHNKLFSDRAVALRQVAIGALGTALLVIALTYAHLPFWLAATIGGFAGGFAMPYLFRNIKFQ